MGNSGYFGRVDVNSLCRILEKSMLINFGMWP